MIQDTSYSDECLADYILAIRKEWMDKTKMVHSIISSGNFDRKDELRDRDTDMKLLQNHWTLLATLMLISSNHGLFS